MFGHPPTYRNLPHFSYDPRLQSSYYSNVPVQNPWSVAQEQAVTERASAMAEQRARRAQYLPDEDVDSEDEWEYNQFGPRERAYLDARKRQDILRKRFMEEEAVRQRALEEKRWQDSLDRRKQEDEVKRRQIIERRKLQREEEEEATANKRGFEQSRSHARENGLAHGTSPSFYVPSRSPDLGQGRSTSCSVPIKSSGEAISQPLISKREYQEEHHQAASTIQKYYRIHQSIQAIDNLKSQFEDLKRQFSYPEKLDFQEPGSDGVITISANADDDTDLDLMNVDDASKVKLAFTSRNFALNQYSDSLDKMLVKLDGVESWGNKKVREKRRGVVKEIEEEAEKLERYWKQRWWRYSVKLQNY